MRKILNEVSTWQLRWFPCQSVQTKVIVVPASLALHSPSQTTHSWWSTHIILVCITSPTYTVSLSNLWTSPWKSHNSKCFICEGQSPQSGIHVQYNWQWWKMHINIHATDGIWSPDLTVSGSKHHALMMVLHPLPPPLSEFRGENVAEIS
jgi:hypothetical protein